MFEKSFIVVSLLIIESTQIIDTSSKIEVRTDIKGRPLTPEEGCGQSIVPNNNRIVGGESAKNGAWPWMALIGYRNETHIDFSCGGSLITTRHVLSGAYCWKIGWPIINVVRLGEYDTHSKENRQHIDIDIHRIKKHPNFFPYLMVNDIAVVRLVRDVDFTDYIRPICLPTNEHMRKLKLVGLSSFVAGWGLLNENDDKWTAGILQQVQVPIIENEDCRKNYKTAVSWLDHLHIRFNKSYVLCAGYAEGGKAACDGDTGGPMMLPVKYENGHFPFYQIGIFSHGFGCGRPNIPGIYTNVRFYVDWVIGQLD